MKNERHQHEAPARPVRNSENSGQQVSPPPDVHRELTDNSHGVDRLVDATPAQLASIGWFFRQGMRAAAAGQTCEPPKHLLPDIPDLQVYCLMAWQRGWLTELGYPRVKPTPIGSPGDDQVDQVTD